MTRTKQTARKRTDLPTTIPHRVISSSSDEDEEDEEEEDKKNETMEEQEDDDVSQYAVDVEQWPEASRLRYKLFQTRNTLEAYRSSASYMHGIHHHDQRQVTLQEVEKLEQKEREIIETLDEMGEPHENKHEERLYSQVDKKPRDYWYNEKERIGNLFLDTSAISSGLASQQHQHFMEMNFARSHHLFYDHIPPRNLADRMLLSRGMYIAAYFSPWNLAESFRDSADPESTPGHATQLYLFLNNLQSTVAEWLQIFKTSRCDSRLLQHIHDLTHALNYDQRNSYSLHIHGANVTLFQDLCAFAESKMFDLARSTKLAMKNTIDALILHHTHQASQELTVKKYWRANRHRIEICFALDEIDNEICFAMRDIEQIVVLHNPWLQEHITAAKLGTKHLQQKWRERKKQNEEDYFNPDHI